MYNEDKEPAATEAGNGVPEPGAAHGDEDRPTGSVAAAETDESAAAVRERDDAADDDAAAPDEAETAEASDTETPETKEGAVAAVARAPKKAKPAAARKGAKKTAGKAPAKAKKTTGAAKKRTEDAVAAEAPTEEPENKLPMKWYAVHTYSGHENKVKENIQKMVKTSGVKEQFGRLIVPTEEVAEMRKGKKTITTRKFFPSYILIEMFMSEDSWHLVNSIPGVTSFVGTGTTPQPLAETEVERVLGRMDKERETIVPEIPFTLGEHIRIKDGPFSDFSGIIDEINTEKGKLRVLVSIFGRETPVELDFLQVEPI